MSGWLNGRIEIRFLEAHQMATPEEFARLYGPAAARAGQALGVDPAVLLGQFGLETGWGKSIVPGTNNLGNIKDFRGGGVPAVDNMTGSRDSYRKYESPDAFFDDYVDLIQRKYPNAVGVGDDAAKFGRALKFGGYAEDPAYVPKVAGATNAIRNLGDRLAEFLLPAAQAGTSPQTDKFADIFADIQKPADQPAQPAQDVLPPSDKFADIFADAPTASEAPRGSAAPGITQAELPPAAKAALAPTTNSPQITPTANRGGIGGGLFMGAVRDPLDAGAQMLVRGVRSAAGLIPDALGGEAARQFMDGQVAGVDSQIRSANQEYDASREMAGRSGLDVARGTGNVLSPANIPAARILKGASTALQLATRGGAAGAATAVLQPVVDAESQDSFASTKVGQGVLGAAAGAALTPVMARATEAIAQQAGALLASVKGPTVLQVEAAVQRAAKEVAGQDASSIPQEILAQVRKKIGESLLAGRATDPAAHLRRAEFEMLGMQPTLGQITRDPMQFAAERNMRGINMSGSSQAPGNPLATRFSEQNSNLVQHFDRLGAGRADDIQSAGARLINHLRAADGPAKDAVDMAYSAARGADGRYANLNVPAFVEHANAVLDEQMLGRWLPGNVRGLLNDVAGGKTPLNVNTATQIDSVLSEAQRSAGRAGDRAAAMAVGAVRDALHAAPLADDAAGGAGSAARAAFDKARGLARDRFATIEGSPALKAALDGADPDTFVRRYILGASTQEMRTLKGVLEKSPEAMQQVRAQVAEHLRNAAFGSNAAADAPMAVARYMTALRNLGREKLETVFSAGEVERLMTMGRVGQYITTQPAGSAVNNSNTASATMNLLAELSGSVGRMPLVRIARDQLRGWQTDRAVARALAAQPGSSAPELSPKVMEGLRTLFPLAPIAGGSAGGSLLK
ncbi:glucosaminidase domain-containing protein [Bordetella avium]|uniref:glucosaminidase domain-containing protein n=1 Tax=Bordetella avium TaxID=521 RepID=UPI0013792867|nr:glucosaminidase domain-containing protein [Bordetella avium]